MYFPFFGMHIEMPLTPTAKPTLWGTAQEARSGAATLEQCLLLGCGHRHLHLKAGALTAVE